MPRTVNKRIKTPAVTEPLGYTIADATRVSGIGRTALYKALQTGEIKAVKQGRHSIVLAGSLTAYLHALPAAAFRAPESAG